MDIWEFSKGRAMKEKENDDFGNSEVEETEKDNKKNKKVK